jgi:PAS domain S-box-containing protein
MKSNFINEQTTSMGETEIVHENLNSMMAYWDKNLVCRFANQAYLDWFGIAPEDMINKITIQELLGSSYEKNVPLIEGALSGKAQVFTKVLNLYSGEPRRVVIAYYPDIRHDTVEGFFAHAIDITESSNLEVEKTIYEAELRALITKTSTNSLAIDNSVAKVDVKMYEVAESLKANLLNKFPGLEQLANLHLVSVSKLKRDFKAVYNVSPYAYYRNLQMIYANHYINTTKCSKKEIAAILDFSNPANFYSLFKKFKQNPHI